MSLRSLTGQSPEYRGLYTAMAGTSQESPAPSLTSPTSSITQSGSSTSVPVVPQRDSNAVILLAAAAGLFFLLSQ